MKSLGYSLDDACSRDCTAPSPGSIPGIQTVNLEIDAETRVVRRMVVRRTLNGLPFATVTYPLAETDSIESW